MPIPFLSYFKKSKDEAVSARATAPKPTPPPLEKPSSERLSRTVMPNATRTVARQDAFQVASRSSAMGGSTATAAAPAPGGAPSPGAPRAIAFAAPARPRDLPPAVALAPEPKIERVISLDLADIIAQMPAGYVKPAESIEVNRRVLLKTSEVEKGMSSGRPTVSLVSIYQQIPEIFLRSVGTSDAAQVQLPFAKVLEQFTSLQVRGDQQRHHAVPQVETPFLKVTLEDNARFGTKTENFETAALPPVKVEPATAEAFAAAEPEPAAHEKFGVPASNGLAQRPTGGNAAPPPTRVPFKLAPNGTDAPAPECVPASSGPSVPNTFATPPAPMRIPFKITAPSDDLRPKPEPWLTAENSGAFAVAPVASSTGDTKIILPLKPIMEGIPVFQLNDDINSVGADARIELPFSLIEPQLASGRVTVTPKVFQAGLPPEYRPLFNVEAAGADIALPLQEVLKNLPAASLRMREDQEEEEAGANFATPFSAKAEEDAKRFNVAGTPVPKPETPPAAGPPPRATEKSSERTPLQVALETDDELDAKAVVERINKMPGVKSCAIMFGDGLSLAGSLPPEMETEGLCAMAPSLMQRIENHMADTKLGALRGLTLSCMKAAVTFFMHDNLCLAALHSSGELGAEVREKLARVVHELSRKYSHPV